MYELFVCVSVALHNTDLSCLCLTAYGLAEQVINGLTAVRSRLFRVGGGGLCVGSR